MEGQEEEQEEQGQEEEAREAQEEAVLQGSVHDFVRDVCPGLSDECSREAHTNCGYQYRDPQQQHLHAGLRACVP